MSQPVMDIETKLREAQIEHMVQRFLRWRLPENFNPDGGIIFSHTSGGHINLPVGTNLFDYQQAKAMVIHMLEGLPDEQADTIAALRKQVSDAVGERDALQKKLSACRWYWPEDDTSSEACGESAQEIVQNAYDWEPASAGDVIAVARGGIVEVTYCASLPPADEADSDDEFWVEEKTYEAASLKVADEQSRRTLASLREADHA